MAKKKTDTDNSVINFNPTVPASSSDLINKAKAILGKKDSGTSPAKSKQPIINDPKLYNAVSKTASLIKDIKNLEADLEIQKETISGRVRKDYEDGKASQGSFKLTDKTGNPVIMTTYKNAFTQIPIEQEDTIRDLMTAAGKNFDQYFTPSYEIKMKDTSINGVAKLIELLGEEKFEKYFEVSKQTIKVCDNMDSMQFDLPEEVKPFVKQYKASFKTVN
jgi:hypothetical protein